MLGSGILAEDGGILGLGARGEREFGRRHFADLVAAFTEPLLLVVRHGPVDVGAVHPASLAPSARGEAPVLSLGGRSWKVTDVDWRRRAVAVVPADGAGDRAGSGRGGAWRRPCAGLRSASSRARRRAAGYPAARRPPSPRSARDCRSWTASGFRSCRMVLAA